jgi:alanine racemase
MPRPIRARIDLSALRHNVALARRAAGAASLLAVVKADGYGHGLLRILPALEQADGLALVEVDRAVALREAGERRPLVLLGGFYDPAELEIFSRYALWPVVHHIEQLRMLSAARLRAPLHVFLKFNSGMNRLGLQISLLDEALRDLATSRNAATVTLMTHFANADDARGVDWQMEVFARAIQGRGLPVSMANSAALLRYPQSRGEWVRPGIVLYGSSPFADCSAHDLGLRPVMTLETRVVGEQRLKSGDRVGYGGTYAAEKPMRIGVIACGYADGYSRHSPSGTPVLVEGRRTRTVGLVSMDLTCIDLTDLPDAGVGSRVVLWGEGLPVDEVATAARTVSYELLCALGNRVPVLVVDTGT